MLKPNCQIFIIGGRGRNELPLPVCIHRKSSTLPAAGYGFFTFYREKRRTLVCLCYSFLVKQMIRFASSKPVPR